MENSALKELETYLENQIAEAERSIREYQKGLTRCCELRDGLQRSLDALRAQSKEPKA